MGASAVFPGLLDRAMVFWPTSVPAVGRRTEWLSLWARPPACGRCCRHPCSTKQPERSVTGRICNPSFLVVPAATAGTFWSGHVRFFASCHPIRCSFPTFPCFFRCCTENDLPTGNRGSKGGRDGITAHHTAEHLACAVVEGVAFNPAHYVDILQRASGQQAAQLILSGNGFLNPLAAETLAAVVDAEVRLPEKQGLASLRGAAICAFHALGIDASAAMEQLVADARTISKKADRVVRERLQLYRQLRAKVTVR